MAHLYTLLLSFFPMIAFVSILDIPRPENKIAAFFRLFFLGFFLVASFFCLVSSLFGIAKNFYLQFKGKKTYGIIVKLQSMAVISDDQSVYMAYLLIFREDDLTAFVCRDKILSSPNEVYPDAFVLVQYHRNQIHITRSVDAYEVPDSVRARLKTAAASSQNPFAKNKFLANNYSPLPNRIKF